jgi:membrane associated rhomboid family serine protease
VLIPVGLDEARIGRVPWVSIVLLALNVLVFVGTSLSDADREAEGLFRDVVEYWADRPYLELPPALERRTGIGRQALGDAIGRHVPDPGGPAVEQEHLDELCAALLAALDELPERRWALVPERGLLQPGWITHQFLHGGLGHLVGNMLVFFLVVAPFLEDVWGRPFFLAFYLVGGVVAGAAQALPMGDSPVAILGASGAISACLGAFALRFAHRRVRMFYWFLLFARGTFFVPAWAYACFGLAMDLLGLSMSGTGGGVAYAAHVGGFLFGVGAAVAVRATGLEDRIAPEGAARQGGSLAASRASEALAGGRVVDARRHYEDALARRPDDLEAALGLARILGERIDRAGTTPLVERIVAARIAARDLDGAREVLRELGGAIDATGLRPATAYRAAELVEEEDPGLADRLDEAAAGAGGALGAKALLRLAARARTREPERALAAAERALGFEAVPQELRERAQALVEAVRPLVAPPPGPIDLSGEPPAPSAARPALGSLEPVRLVRCQLVGAAENVFHLATAAGKRALLAPDRIEALAAGVIAEHADGAGLRKNAVLVDVLLATRPGEVARVVLRIPGHAMALSAIHPGVPPRDAFSRVVDALLGAGALALPSAAEAAGRPFARFADAAQFEEASWGRRLGA